MGQHSSMRLKLNLGFQCVLKNKKRARGDITPPLLNGTAGRLQKNGLRPFTEQRSSPRERTMLI